MLEDSYSLRFGAQLKKISKEHKLKIGDLVAESPQNDPFYFGTKADVDKALWIQGIWNDLGKPNIHVRRVHYYVFSKQMIRPDGQLYENTGAAWGYMIMACKAARYLETVPFTAFVDRRNPEPNVNAIYYGDVDKDNLLEALARSAVKRITRSFIPFSESGVQPYHLEIWAEKSTMNDILLPIGEEYNVNIVTGVGEFSLSACRDALERIREADKPTRIFYVSDLDPAGDNMPTSVSRKIEYFVRRAGRDRDVKLLPLVLTKEQCDELDLPRAPIKIGQGSKTVSGRQAKETQKARFEAKHGEGATELDALEALYPGKLHEILSGTIEQFWDREAHEEVVGINDEIRTALAEQLEEKGDEIIESIMEHVDLSEFDDIAPSAGIPNSEEGEFGWLLDTTVGYMDQMEKYRKRKFGF